MGDRYVEAIQALKRTAGIGCVLLAALAGGATAAPPDMPLLAQWVKMLAEGKAPNAAAPLRLLTPKPLPGVDWDDVSPADVQARMWDRGRAFIASVGYSGSRSTGLDGQLYLSSAKGVVREEYGDTHPNLILLDSPQQPRAVLDTGHNRGEPVTIQARGDALQISPIQLKPRPELDPLGPRYDIDTYAGSILDCWTGTSVRLPKNVSGQDVRVLGGNFVLIDVDTTPSETTGAPAEFAWHSRPLLGGRWTQHDVPLPATYCRQTLPGVLGQARLLGDEEDEAKYALWKDGSIIWRFSGEEREGLDELDCEGLVLQPPSGKPRLLAWAVYDALVPYGIDSTAPGSVEDEQAARVLSRVWFPAVGGVESVPCGYHQRARDLYFDVDWTNNAVIYLLGGRLWAIDMSKVSAK